MHEDCLFCKIINKEIPSEIIYEDEMVLVFLDINPTTNGDTLVIPKKHYLDIFETPSYVINHMNKVMKTLYPKYQKKLNCDGFTISTNKDYGQDIKHFHLHFIPRYLDDGVKHSSNKRILKDIKEIKDILK